jgi:hypothetical protein
MQIFLEKKAFFTQKGDICLLMMGIVAHNVYLGPDINILYKLDDIFVSQANTTLGTPSANRLGGIGSMNTNPFPFRYFQTDEIRSIDITRASLGSPILGILNGRYTEVPFWSATISIVAFVSFVLSTSTPKSAYRIRLIINNIHLKRFFRNHNCILCRKTTNRKQKSEY